MPSPYRLLVALGACLLTSLPALAQTAAPPALTADDYRRADSGLAAQQADSALHLAIMDAAHNAVLKQVLLDLEASVSIGAPAHVWGEPVTMREMELRALGEHTTLVDAITEGRGDDAEALARAHVAIDFENISAAMRRAGMLID